MGTTSTESCYHFGCKDLAKHVRFITHNGFLHACDKHAEHWDYQSKMIPLDDIVFAIKKILWDGSLSSKASG